MDEKVTLTINKETFDVLMTRAKREQNRDEEGWYPIDAGNYDDAYEAGVHDGEADTALVILEAAGYEV